MENTTRQILPGSIYTPPQTNYIHQDESIVHESINDFFRSYYYDNISKRKTEVMKNSLLSTCHRNLKKAHNKLSKQKIELQSASDIAHWHQCIELLKHNLHDIHPGMDKVAVINYFDQSMSEIIIALNPTLSPHKNLDIYIKKYKKAMTGQKSITLNITQTEKEIQEIEDRICRINNINDYNELILYNAMTLSNKNVKLNNKQHSVKSLFRSLPISDDWTIFIGRSNKENDILTCKTAKPDDWWFHTRIFQGTHVLLRNHNKKEPSKDLILLCSRLAAYYSKAKSSSNVPVDYTMIKYVTKPRGAVTGYVIYKNQKTIYVNPIDLREASKMLLFKE